MTPERRQAQRASAAVHREVRAGRMTVQSCAVCGLDPSIEGVQRIQAHHHRGYDEEHVLDVRWLCRKHHQAAHGGGPYARRGTGPYGGRSGRKKGDKKSYTVRIPAQVLGSLLRVSRGRGMTGPGRVAEMILDRFHGEKGKGMAAIDGFEAISSQRYEPYGRDSDWVPLNLDVDGDLLGEIAAASAWTGIRRLRIVPLILMGCRGRFYDLVETGAMYSRARAAVKPCEVCGMEPEKFEGVQRTLRMQAIKDEEENP